MPVRARPQGPLTHTEVREQLAYDPETGVFTWKVAKPRIRIGMVAGTGDFKGYTRITICSKEYMAHRLVFFYMTEEWPPAEMQVDHISMVRNDNRWDNLRIVTQGQNQMNTDRYGEDRGLTFCGGCGWRVRLRIKNHYQHLGYFKDKEEARQVYLTALREHHAEKYLHVSYTKT